MKSKARILIATHNISDTELIENLLRDEFDNILLSTEPDQAVQDFDTHRPQVLVLAFHALEKSEQFYLGLYRSSSIIHNHAHHTLVLCEKDQVQRAYELCKRDHFDDYIVFWPLTHDAKRLSMAIHHALRELRNVGENVPSAGEIAQQARRIAELEARLDQYVDKGKSGMDSVSSSIGQAKTDIGAALDIIANRLSEPALQGLAEDRERNELRRVIDRVKIEEIDKHIGTITDAMQPVHQWADTLKDTLAPQLESARILGSMAERMRPLMLIVDDDEFQHQLLRQILSTLNLELTFAVSSTEAMATLRRRRPDLILMDINLPDVNGIQITRHIKSVEQLAGIPVIMITGRSEKNVVMDSMQAGASDYVVKPFDRKKLIDKVVKALGIKAPLVD